MSRALILVLLLSPARALLIQDKTIPSILLTSRIGFSVATRNEKQNHFKTVGKQAGRLGNISKYENATIR